MPRDEVAFLGILLFSMLDVNLKRDPFSLHPGFAGQAGHLRDRVLVYLKQETGLILRSCQWQGICCSRSYSI